jgi:hypothetical protein
MNMHRLILAALAALALGACASGYHARADGESGYAEQQLGPTRWRVEYTGEGTDLPATVDSYLLQRAAEITVENGYDWFVPAGADAAATDEDIIVEASRPQASTAPVWRPRWRRRDRNDWTDWDPRGPPENASDMGPSPAPLRYAASAEVVLGRGPVPPGGFGARDLLASQPH